MPRRRSRARGILALSVMVGATLAGAPARAAVTVEHGIIESWDTTDVYYTIFEPPGPFTGGPSGDVPVIFMTHGWGGSRVKDPSNSRVQWLVDRGYAVVTWDSRGFGQSGGEANVDAQEYEVRDLRRLIDEIAARPEIATDDADFVETIPICEFPLTTPPPVRHIPVLPSPIETILFPSPSPEPEPTCIPATITIEHLAMDPKMGMLGGSYAGGIQLMAAAIDPRIDAIIPEITWNDLPQSLKPNGVLRLGWDLLLYGAGAATGATGGLTNEPVIEQRPSQTLPSPIPDVELKHGPEAGVFAPQIHQALVEGVALNDWSTATFDWFDEKSTKHYIDGGALHDDTPVPGVEAATMLIQGVNDTLFPIDEAIKTYEAIKDRVPAKLVFFCGGHTWATVNGNLGTALDQSCQAGPGQAAHLDDLRARWLERYVKGNASVDTGAAVEYPFQDGTAAGDLFYARAALPDRGIFSSRLQVFGDTRLKNVVAPTNGTVLGTSVAGCHERAGRVDVNAPAASCPARVTEADWMKIGTFTGPPEPGDRTRRPTLEPPQPGSVILGTGRVRLGVLSSGPDAYYFFKLIEWDPIAKKAVVVGNQVTSVKVTWASLEVPKFVAFDLAGVAWKIKDAQTDSLGQKAPYEYYLEVTTTSNTHASSRYPNQSTLFVDASIPMVAPPRVFTPATNSSPKPITEPERPVIASTGATFEGTAEPGAVVTFKDFGATVGTATTGADGNWSFAKPGGWTEGHHIMTATSPSDLAGRDVLTSGERCFVVDDPAVAPNSPVVNAPTDGGTVTTSSVKFEGTSQAGTTVFVREPSLVFPPLEGFPPSLEGHLKFDQVRVHDFAPNEDVTLTIWDEPDGEIIAGPSSKQTDGAGEATFAFEDHGVDLVPGLYIEATDGTLTRDLTLEALTVGTVNAANDTVSGTAPAGAEVFVDVHRADGDASDSVVALANGTWSINFTPFDITTQTSAFARVHDADGDFTSTELPDPSKKTTGCPAKDILGNVTVAGVWSVSKSGMAAGSHTVEIVARDAAGNVSAPVTITFTKA